MLFQKEIELIHKNNINHPSEKDILFQYLQSSPELNELFLIWNFYQKVIFLKRFLT